MTDAHAGAGPLPGAPGLWLLPVPLGPDADPIRVLPPDTIETMRRLRHFVVENAKTARAVLKRVGTAHPLQELELRELNQHTPPADLPALLAPLREGHDLGLMSDAGCPAVADPGAALVALAHQQGIAVHPLVGPSSLLLALMASGLSGQSFAFVGYLPVPEPQRRAALLALERRAQSERQTQLVIETPYRNAALFETMLACLAEPTRLGVAAELTLPGERIRVRSIAQWRRDPQPPPREPTVFLIGADAGAPGLSAAPAPRRRR